MGDSWALALAVLGNKSKTGSKSRQNKYDSEKAEFCDFHGYCNHSSKDCKVSHKTGEKAKNFRSER